MTDTHYVPAFTVEQGSQRLTVCGLYVHWRAHSATPTCATCAAYLVAEPEPTADEAQRMADDLFGTPSTSTVSAPFFDPLAGYKPRS
jgi:hypothetical protein